MSTSSITFYTWFNGRGRRVLADEFGTDDPFDLEPGEIVDRIMAAGYTPWIAAPQPEALPMLGTVTEVKREGLVYFVAISRDAEEIGVQERREEAYDLAE